LLEILRPSLPKVKQLRQDEARAFLEMLDAPLKNGLTKPTRVRGRGTRMVNMGEIFAHRRIGDIPMARVPLSDAEQAYLLEPGDLLFARQSLVLAGAGKCSIFTGASEPVTYEGHIIRARPNKRVADPVFYFYYFNSTPGRRRIESITEQVAAAGIRGSDLAKLAVPCPPLPVQRSIACVLGALDDKIELNRKMNETLEQMARAIFKSWFVDFEPFRDKGMVESDLGDIPKGWKIGRLGDVLDQRVERCEASPETAARPYVPIDCISSKSLFLAESKPGTEAQSSLTKFYKGDLLFGAMRPYFHKVCIAPFDGTTRTTAFVLVPKALDDFAFATLLLHRPDTIDYATRHSTGSTIPYAVWAGSLEEMPAVISPREIRVSFDAVVRPILTRIPVPCFENRTLAAIRDALLPKLMSGEVRATKCEGRTTEANGRNMSGERRATNREVRSEDGRQCMT